MPRVSPEVLHANLNRLGENPYPGRGIIQGLGAAADRAMQVYWLMGRSPSSRARTLLLEPDTASPEERLQVSTQPFNLPEGTDTSLIIYNALRSVDGSHIVTNGDQTDTIVDAIRSGDTFDEALYTRTYEPDAPNYTPRISGIIDLEQEVPLATLSVIRKNALQHHAFHGYILSPESAGTGLTVHTYMGDGDPLPSFRGSPYPLQLGETVEETAELYWDTLNPDNRVALVAKSIDLRSGEEEYKIINANG